MRNYQTNPDGPALYVPTREEVQSLKVGDLAPDAFGRMSEVTEIFGQKDDINGRAFVCYYTRFGSNGGSCSTSMKEGELVRSVAASGRYTSADLIAIERKINAERASLDEQARRARDLGIAATTIGANWYDAR